MENETTVTIETEPVETTETQSTERTLGQLETETEHLSETVDELETELETTQAELEQTQDLAESAMQETWATRAEISELRSEMNQRFEAIAEMLQDDADGLESETEIVELPEPVETEPVAEVKTSRIPSWII